MMLWKTSKFYFLHLAKQKIILCWGRGGVKPLSCEERNSGDSLIEEICFDFSYNPTSLLFGVTYFSCKEEKKPIFLDNEKILISLWRIGIRILPTCGRRMWGEGSPKSQLFLLYQVITIEEYNIQNTLVSCSNIRKWVNDDGRDWRLLLAF